jgi:atrial natriuretic peptide receptor A
VQSSLNVHSSNVHGKSFLLNNFISAFYDAVLLYAMAVRETVDAGGDARNGTAITERMWNRTFEGAVYTSLILAS